MPSANPPPPTTNHGAEAAADEEEDYLTMTFTDPAPQTSAKSSNRSITALHKSRLLHAETAGRPKSKAEIAREGERKREAGLKRKIWEVDREDDGEAQEVKKGEENESKNKGLAMMRKLGWREGMALGAAAASDTATTTAAKAAAAGIRAESTSNGERGSGYDGVSNGAETLKPQPSLSASAAAAGRLDPLTVEIKDGREGIGLESERKRQLREEFERHEQERKKREVEEEGYRERVIREAEERRVEGQCWGAMKVLEKLDEEEAEAAEAAAVEGEGDGSGSKQPNEEQKKKRRKRRQGTKPLRSIPMLYRSLVRARRTEDRDRRMRHDLQTSLPTSLSLSRYANDSADPDPDPDPDSDADDRIALGKNDIEVPSFTAELDSDADTDTELQEFDTLAPKERLARLVAELRSRWRYCFWCKYRYRDGGEMEEGCPGEGEEEHG